VNEIIIAIISLLPLLVLKKGRFFYFSITAIVAIALHGTYLFGPRILYLFLFTYIVSTIGELVCLKTPIGCFGIKYWYHRNPNFFSSRIKILGVYPIEVTFAWVILKYLSFCLAMIIVQAFLLPLWIVIFLTPLILVSLDFVIDPVSVHAFKLWSWERGSKYFGIPWENFLGWYLYGFIATLAFSFIGHEQKVAFSFLYVLPIIFYASFLQYSLPTLKINKKLAIIGSVPVVIWTILSTIGLIILYFR